MMSIKHIYKYFKLLLIIVPTLSLIACGDIVGPKGISKTRMSYNSSLQSSDSEQFLINIVRLRYGEGVYFIGINNITSQTNLLTSSGGLFSYQDNGGLGFSSLSEVSPKVTYEQKPTISYTPLQGSAFMDRMLKPVSLDKVTLLIKSGWSPSLILRTVFQNIGVLDNASLSSRYVSSYKPEYQNFVKFSYYLYEIDRENYLKISSIKYKNKPAILVTITNQNAQRQVENYLKLNKPYKTIILADSDSIDDSDTYNSNVLPVQTRSFMGILYYLSKSVKVQEDYKNTHNGVIPETINSDGSFFDWTLITNNLMSVSISKNEPVDAAIKIYYKDQWFYVKGSDQDSKREIILLDTIFSLESGELKADSPVITVPV